MITKQYQSLFNIVKACFDYFGMYRAENPVVERHGRLLSEACSFWWRRDGSLTLQLQSNQILINHHAVDRTVFSMPTTQWFLEACIQRKIYEVLILQGATIEDIHAFIGLLHRDSYFFSSHGSASQILQGAGVYKIQVNPPALEDSFNRQAPFSIGTPTPAFKKQSPEEESTAPEREAGIRRTEDLVPGLFISTEDYETLYGTMQHLVDQQQMTKVADSLTLMRNDLRSLDRGDRELAFSSYQVLVKVLIQNNELKALYRIVKAMPFDLRICQEFDLYRIHLETFADILRHFGAEERYRPLLYGLTVMAEQSQRHRDPYKTLLENNLKSFLEPRFLERLVRAADSEQGLRTRMNILFREHALGIFNSLMQVLFETKERRLRKILLDTLFSMGDVIFPDVMKELDLAIRENKPWYVRRNLLLLLSVKPPISLVPTLKWLLENETSKRVLDQVYRCLFLIEDSRTLELGYRLLTQQEDENRLIRLLDYVAYGGQSGFAPILIELSEDHDSERVRHAALMALGKLDCPVSIDYLKSIVNKTSFFKTRSSSGRRVAAVRALGATRAPHHISFLTKFMTDKDDSVRHAIQEVLTG
ncbi:HEAT repeat domain-containing protein [Sulfidibacter corallicola]|uniref:HEAT repeat domain-containing protein n=1 Tax=Sulfidibacter corallicola TaxID=2818388 RepID=A0A8A4TVX5_SULCO|nr:HEAT repeat domain-containing protein [Sulfidibacter corallicola]QTD53311.1 HEAT repeat domain-containing protein [Sulfidibacter corallicola]